MYGSVEKNKDGSIKRIKIQMDNSDIFTIEQDIEGFLEITKQFSVKSETLNINPRYTNQITVN